ncbi:RICIN domain-containing protein [Nocardioides marmorisolisilvae]|uniref:Ricin B lectin domain-containing protein n=1 Tax=Nocardioides marmorisolisilvae TaxID=1542737 RepID=A0A3N0DSR2_9ACTN|nr:RICIN domain-containing protein [Nocardioides marmorisolisilvae]RNL78516.1 hypothetical protein EFL95_05325 [Nocardioides marmorisolisilvae]
MNTSKKALLASALLTALAPLPLGLTTQAVADATAAPAPIKETLYLVRVTNLGSYTKTFDDGKTKVFTKEAIEAQVDRGLRYWETATDNRIAFTRKPTLDFATSYDCDHAGDILHDAAAKIPELHGINIDGGMTTAEHVMVIVPPGCTHDGFGLLGGGFNTTGGVFLSLTTNNLFQAVVHELGHNFGLDHANAIKCTDVDGCVRKGYANNYAPMSGSFPGGSSSEGPDEPALSSFERDRLGVAAPGELQSFALPENQRTRTLVFDLHPRSSQNGLRGVSVVDPTDPWKKYWIDFRNGFGADEKSQYMTWFTSGAFVWNRGVTVEQVDVKTNSKGVDYLSGESTLQTYPQLDHAGYRYALTADPREVPFEQGGVKLSVTSMQLNGTADDVAQVRITLTNPNVPLFVQDSGAVAINNKGDEGSTLTATTSGWADDATLGRVQWLDNGTVVGAGPTYQIPAGSHGHQITAQVTGSRESYEDRTATSNAVVVGQGYTGTLVKGATYEIRSVSGGLLVSNQGPTTASSNTQAIAVAGDATTNTQWQVIEVSPGVYQLRNVASQKCLDNEAVRTVADKPVIQWGCTSGINQRWTLVGSGTGYALINQTSGFALAPQGTDNRLVHTGNTFAWTFKKVS